MTKKNHRPTKAQTPPATPLTFEERARAYWTPEQTAKLLGNKKYLVVPAEAPTLLRVMGLLNNDSSMSADNVRKFMQVNHMLNLLVPALQELAERQKVVNILDACCGSSFIALVAAWLLHEKWKKPCRVLGIDRNEAVITKSRERAEILGWGDFVRFSARDVNATAWQEAMAEQFPGVEAPRPHLMCALHACDTATDHALSLGIHAEADFMAVAPCCQAELARIWSEIPASQAHPMQPIFQSPNLRRDTAALMTDSLRLLLIRSHGYEVTATEFVPSAHTPKNRLLVCTRRGRFHKESQAQYAALKESLANSTITLEMLVGVSG